jgi:hypothetical protein
VSNPPDLVLIDLVRHAVTGSTPPHTLKEQTLRLIPVVIVGAVRSPRALEYRRCTTFSPKPFDPMERTIHRSKLNAATNSNRRDHNPQLGTTIEARDPLFAAASGSLRAMPPWSITGLGDSDSARSNAAASSTTSARLPCAIACS